MNTQADMVEADGDSQDWSKSENAELLRMTADILLDEAISIPKLSVVEDIELVNKFAATSVNKLHVNIFPALPSRDISWKVLSYLSAGEGMNIMRRLSVANRS